MALINCSECGNQVSDKAEKCPHCGIASPISLEEKNHREANLRKIEEERIKENELKRVREEEKLQKKKIEDEIQDKKAQKGLFVFLGIISTMGIILAFLGKSTTSYSVKKIESNGGTYKSTSNNSSYCYDMWYKYGSCVYLSANGLPCKAGTNVIIPIECQNFSGKIEASKAGMLSNK